MKVQIVIFDGFDELDAIGPYEVLQTAAKLGADIHVELATIHGSAEVVAAHGLHVRPHARLTLRKKIDVLIVPGGNWNDRGPQGTRIEVARGEIPKLISKLHRAGTLIAGVCTGVMLLAAADLLAGRPATTHHLALEDLREFRAEIVQSRVVDDGDIITAGGVTSGLDLALWLVERYFDARTANRVAREIEYERRGIVWQRA